MIIQKNAVKEQIMPVIARANYNRNVNGMLNPDDKQKLESMINDIENKLSELSDAREHIKACLDAGEPVYS